MSPSLAKPEGISGRKRLSSSRTPTSTGFSFFLTQNDARSNYNALQVQYRRPITKQVQALLNYSFSHSLDNASNDYVAGVSNTEPSMNNDDASSDFNACAKVFLVAATGALPSAARVPILSFITRDWSLDTMVVARSGFPLNGSWSSVGRGSCGRIHPARSRTRAAVLDNQSFREPAGRL